MKTTNQKNDAKANAWSMSIIALLQASLVGYEYYEENYLWAGIFAVMTLFSLLASIYEWRKLK